MAEIRCEDVSAGLRRIERLVTVRNAVSGLLSFLRVEADFLTYHEGHYYLPVGVVQEEPEHGLALIELPQEPDAGDTRLWVRTADILQPSKRAARPGNRIRKAAQKSSLEQRREATMTEILCERVSRGMRDEERTVMVRDAVSKLRSFLRVETDFLTYQDGKFYLPVGVVQQEPQLGLALVELPQEPDAGNTRLWVRTADFLQPSKAST